MFKYVICSIAGNFDVFDAFQPDRQNLTHEIFKSIQCLVNDCDHPSKYFRKIFQESVSIKISSHQNFLLYGRAQTFSNDTVMFALLTL